MLTWVDYAIIAIIVLSMLVSLARGFLREALSLLSWILACWVALTFTSVLERIISPFLPDFAPRLAVAFLVLFIATLVVTALLTYLVSLMVEKAPPSLADRLSGTVFGALRGALVVTLLVMLSDLSALPRAAAWRDAVLLPRFEQAALSVRALLPAGASCLFPE